MSFSAIIVAAGSGARTGGGARKQWRLLGGKPVALWSIEAFVREGAKEIVVVVRPDQFELAQELLGHVEAVRIVGGGAQRSDSVKAGLEALSPVEAVMVHDAARPFVGGEVIARLLEALEQAEGAIPALPVPDTLKRGDAQILETVSRDGLQRAQTPQAFRLKALQAAYAQLPADTAPTDDAGVLETAGGQVALVPGDPLLFKLTWPEDFGMADLIARGRMRTRTGTGFDAHRLGEGDHVWLCGVKIPHDHGLVGHSDADVGLHALTDAILGAIAGGDIGAHFPPSDPQWKGASSDRFLAHAGKLVSEAGGSILNLDVTLICEAPKIGPHRESMRARIADILGITPGQVSVKATTTEGMGFTGRGEGIAAQAIATVELPA